MRCCRRILILCFPLLFLRVADARADSLQELLKSDEMQEVTAQTSKYRFKRKQEEAKLKTKAKASTNHDKLFTADGERTNYLINWSCTRIPGYQSFRDKLSVEREYIDSKRIYDLGIHRSITVRFLVPHPNVVPMAELGLLKAFSALVPPNLSYEEAEDFTIRGKRSTLYRKRNGSCSMVFKLPKFSLLNINAEDCRDLKHLFDIAESLNIERVERKLNS